MDPEALPTTTQQERAQRSLAVLRQRSVPVRPETVFAADECQVTLRPVAETVRRVRVLQAVVQRAEAAPRDLILREVSKRRLWDGASPSEKRFLECDVPDEQESRRLVRRLEAAWALMWVLGYVPELGWPGQRCNIPKLGKLLHPREGIKDLEGMAQMRPLGEVLDAMALLLRLDAVVRHAEQAALPLPANLDWSQPEDLLRAEECPGAWIVAERLHALRWLTGDVGAESF